MRNRSLITVILVAVVGGQVPAEGPTSRPAGQGAAGPAAMPSSGNPVVDGILDRLETKGQAIKGLKCDLTYKYVTVIPVEDSQIKNGQLLFARGEPNSKFLVHFTKLTAGGVTRDVGMYHAFDGRWYVERNDLAKTVTKREIARPGEHKDAFKLGSGPFPLPFGQKRADILSNFKVTLEPFTLGDLRGSEHLHCLPLPNTELAQKYARVEFYVDKSIELPVRIVTERVSDGNRIEVDFKNIDTHEAPAGSRFQIEEPKDFETTTEPLTNPDEPMGKDK